MILLSFQIASADGTLFKRYTCDGAVGGNSDEEEEREDGVDVDEEGEEVVDDVEEFSCNGAGLLGHVSRQNISGPTPVSTQVFHALCKI